LLKKDSPTNLHAAKIAATPVKTTAANLLAEKCSLQLALHAARKLRFRLSQEKTDLFIAASAFPSRDNFIKK